MKLQKNSDGYSILLNDEGQPAYCIKRTPATTIVPDKLGQPQALVIPTLTNYCGDHCPFFMVEPTDGGHIVNLCDMHIRGISEVINQTDNKPALKLL
jgi:hypothetical protein